MRARAPGTGAIPRWSRRSWARRGSAVSATSASPTLPEWSWAT